ncbi:hypothetical protein AB0A95_34645 [Micromonospora sp. NPDC049230]|uniref:hypothetical protein n=1 Tax=Micromonospora sp. NPDC049230 TaxID=3155502 RepID=UPI0033E5AB81
MSAGEVPRIDSPYRVEETDRPGVYAVLGDVGGMPLKLAEVQSTDGRLVAVKDVATALAQPGPAAAIDLARVEAAAAAALDAAVAPGCVVSSHAATSDRLLPQPGTRRAQVLAEIERQAGQTTYGLRARLKIGSRQVDRALRQLVAAGLVGIVPDERRRARYVSMEQWLRGGEPR